MRGKMETRREFFERLLAGVIMCPWVRKRSDRELPRKESTLYDHAFDKLELRFGHSAQRGMVCLAEIEVPGGTTEFRFYSEIKKGDIFRSLRPTGYERDEDGRVERWKAVRDADGDCVVVEPLRGS